jgi:hypothetical protein
MKELFQGRKEQDVVEKDFRFKQSSFKSKKTFRLELYFFLLLPRPPFPSPA